MTTLNGTDKFDARLAVLQRTQAHELEVNAAIELYERVRTARAIAESLFKTPDDSVVMAVLRELSADVRMAHVAAETAATSMRTVDGADA